VKKQGFTLVEILIVVAIVGLLSGLAIPHFLNARKTAQRNLCLSHLKHIDDAKAMWAVTEGGLSSDEPTWSDLVPDYLRKIPVCPEGGTYTIGIVDANATCSIADHKLSE